LLERDSKRRRGLRPGKYLALDCEMVGVGVNGSRSSLARVSLVNYFGAIQLDEFVQQSEKVVDYRTKISGVRKKDLINGVYSILRCDTSF
jgi:RNA exonuclease 4